MEHLTFEKSTKLNEFGNLEMNDVLALPKCPVLVRDVLIVFCILFASLGLGKMQQWDVVSPVVLSRPAAIHKPTEKSALKTAASYFKYKLAIFPKLHESEVVLPKASNRQTLKN